MKSLAFTRRAVIGELETHHFLQDAKTISMFQSLSTVMFTVIIAKSFEPSSTSFEPIAGPVFQGKQRERRRCGTPLRSAQSLLRHPGSPAN